MEYGEKELWTDVWEGWKGPVDINTNVTKSSANAELKFTYKFYEIVSSAMSSYLPNEDLVITTTASGAMTHSKTFAGYDGGPSDSITFGVILKISDSLGNELATLGDISTNTFADSFTLVWECLPAGTMIAVEVEEEDENGKKKKVRKKKRIEDLTYDDDLVVWDFDNGCFTTVKPLWLKQKDEAEEYNLVKFSDGTELKTVVDHRIFNKELGKFTYTMSDETPIGTTTFTEDGKEITLVSKEVVKEKVDFYNVISDYHMNVFADGILTSCRLSNLYEIKDMKYVKDGRELVSREEYKEIPDEYFYGLRLAEQPKEVNRENDNKNSRTLTEYVLNCIRKQKRV